MNWYAYFLFLLIWAQVDDFWASGPVLPSAPLADDGDEYIPSQRRPEGDECSYRQKLVLVGLTPQTVDLLLIRRGLPSEWNLTTPFTPPPLYVFMSLQI